MKYKLFILLLPLLLIPFITQGADFVGLVGIPGIENPTEGGLGGYINALYRLSISIAALLAVIKIVAAGAKYMLSDIVTHKEDAKKDIQGALIGLLIVIGAIIILNTVNTDLTNLNLTVATTTIEQSTTIEEMIERQQRNLESIQARATAAQSEVIEQNCPSYSSLYGGDRTRCRLECTQSLKGSFSANWTVDTCTYSEADAGNCNPDLSNLCCEKIQGGDWDDTTRTCSGATEGQAAKKIACGRENRIWDEVGNYCRTASCNVNSDANCCTANGNVWENNICISSDNFDEVTCSRSGPRGSEFDCTLQISECTSSGNRVISQTATSIRCSDNERIEINTELEQQRQSCLADGDTWIAALSTCQSSAIDEPVAPII